MSEPLAHMPVYFYAPMFLGGFLCGIYSGILALYLQCHASTTGGSRNTTRKKIILYALSALYILSVTSFGLNLLLFIASDFKYQYYISIIQVVAFGCSDFIAQSILIYRCWIVWGCNIRVIIIPSFLALAYLGFWLAADGGTFIEADTIQPTSWSTAVTITSLTISMVVNALVTGLIVWRIFTVFPKDQVFTSAKKSSDITRNTLIFFIIESGLALFFIQLTRVILSFPRFLNNGVLGFIIIAHQMLNGITPTVILVRVLIGLSSSDDKEALEEATLEFASQV